MFKNTKMQDIIEMYKEGKSGVEIKKITGISYCKIYKVLNSNNLIRKKDYSQYKTTILEMYSNSKTIIEISQITKICSKKIRKILVENNIRIKKTSEINRKNRFNENYFENIDSSDKAYFLGLLYADGNVYLARNRVQITLKNEDVYILHKFSEKIDSSAKLYIDREKYSKLIVDSKKMCSDLIKLGCFPNKSFTIRFPTDEQVPKEFIHHFIRGIFDGDGCIYFNGLEYSYGIEFTSNEYFLHQISEYLRKNGLKVSKYYKRYKDKEFSCGSIHIYERRDNPIFYNLIYKNCEDLFLKRKKEKFEIYRT